MSVSFHCVPVRHLILRSCMLRPTDEVAPDGFQFLMTMKNYTPKQLLGDERLMVKCMSEVIGYDIKIRQADAMSEFR